MADIRYSADEFCKLSDAKEILFINKQGKWSCLGPIRKAVVKRLCLSSWIYTFSQKNFIKQLDSLEKDPVRFPSNINQIYLDYLNVGGRLLKSRKNPKLQARLISLRYRIEGVSGGLNITVPDEMLLGKILEEARKYKEQEPLFWDHSLSELNLRYLKRAAAYSLYMNHILNEPTLKKLFFEWVLRDKLPPEPFIEFPKEAETLIDHLLTGRIGTLGGDKLKVQKVKEEQSYLKVVTLPIEGRDESLLDKKRKLLLRGNYSLTIEEMLLLFKDKPRRFVDLEYFAQGIMNWNAQHLGYWIPDEGRYSVINLDQNEWWRQLPPLEIMSIDEAKERYGNWVNGINWVVVAKAARKHCNLNIEKCHAYLEIAIPFQGESYYVYDFGKFARHFPYGVVDNMKMFTITTPATVAYPDENIYHTARQQVGYAFEMNHYEGLILMEALRQDIERARSGNMIFQIEAENCAFWIQRHLKEILGKKNVPNLFRANLSKSEAQGALGSFLNFVRTLPSFLQTPMMLLIHYPFGPWRGQYVIDRNGEKVFKALNRTSFWKDINVYMPAYLHYQYEKGLLSSNPAEGKRDKVAQPYKKYAPKSKNKL